MDLAEARLLLARACLAQNDADAAYREAVTAGEEFRAAGRSGWVAIAEFVALVAAESTRIVVERRDRPRGRNGSLSDLERLGWLSESSAVRVSAAQTALRLGDARFARDQLQIAARARDRGRVDRRAAAWLATAHLRAAEGRAGRGEACCRGRVAHPGRPSADARCDRTPGRCDGARRAVGSSRPAVGARRSPPARGVPMGRARPGERLGDPDGSSAHRLAARGGARRAPPPAIRLRRVASRRRVRRRTRGGCSASGVGRARPRPSRRR